MDTTAHDLHTLFAQLGLPNDAAAIRTFIRSCAKDPVLTSASLSTGQGGDGERGEEVRLLFVLHSQKALFGSDWTNCARPV